MVSIKYSIAASALAAAVLAAPALEERGGSWGGSGEVSKGGSWGGDLSKTGSWGGELSKGGSWGGSVAPVGDVIKVIQDCTVGISGAVSLVVSLTIHGDISSSHDAITTCAKAVEGLGKSIPALIAGLKDSIIFKTGGVLAQLCAPGIATIVNLVLQVVSSLVAVIGKLVAKCSDDELTKIVTLLHSVKGLVGDLGSCLGGLVSAGIDFGHDKLVGCIPDIDTAVNSCQTCLAHKECKGW